MNCIVCNRELLDGPMWGAASTDALLHLSCGDELLEFLLHARKSGNAYVKGVVEVLLTGTRLEMERERLMRA